MSALAPRRARRERSADLQSITKPVIQRLAYRGGVKALSAPTYEETRGVLKVFLEEVMQAAVLFAEHARRKTVNPEDIKQALAMKGIKVYSTGSEADMRRCEVPTGKKAITRMRQEQRKAGCYTIPRSAFGGVIRTITSDIKAGGMRFMPQALAVLQESSETYLTGLFEYANLVAIHAGRQTLAPRDMQLIRHIQGNSR